MKLRDRIKELRRVPASDLMPNPKNWRTHPQAQQDALRGVLAEVGIADAVLARETPSGLMLIDGHLRAETAHDSILPVLILDVDEAEADKLLATLDPLAAMAEADAAKLDGLLREIDTGSEALQQMLADLADDAGLYQEEAKEAAAGADGDEGPREDQEPVSREGDVWQLGPHLLAVGDSTTHAVRESVLGDRAPALQIVDPPFDMDYSAWPLIAAPKIVMVWQRGVAALKWESQVLADCYGCHELVFTGGVRGWPCDWFPCTVHDVVRMWRSDAANKSFDAAVLKQSGCRVIADGSRPFSVQEHAGGVLTGYGGMSWGKALVAMEIAMSYIDRDELVWDACAGSGTSLIAAHKHGRVWRGCENQPKWADLIVKRWQEATGQQAVRRPAEESGTPEPQRRPAKSRAR